MSKKTTRRLSVCPDTQHRIREFCRGAGITYDMAIHYLLDAIGQGREDIEAGMNLRNDIDAWERQNEKEA